MRFHSSTESPTNSTYGSPVSPRKGFVSRAGPQRNTKNDKSTEEPIEAFATARGTVKSKRRFSHDEGICGINSLFHQKCSLVRASSDSNIVHNVETSSQQTRPLSSDNSSNSLTNYQKVPPVDTLTPPLVAISPSEGDRLNEQVKVKRQFTSDTSRSFSTGSDHYGDMESEGEVPMSPDMSCPTPKVSIQLPVVLEAENTPAGVTVTNNSNDNCGTLVSEMLEQFPSLLTSPVLSNMSDFSHSLPNNLNMVGLDQTCREEHTTMRSNSITGSVESVTATANSWLVMKAIGEGRTLSEIHEDSAESRASTKSPSPTPADRTLRPRCDAFSDIATQVNITKLESSKSDTFDRKMAAAQDSEQPRVRPIENGRRGSFLARFLPMRGKGKRHQSESEVNSSSSGRQTFAQSHPIPARPSSPSAFEASLPGSLKTATSKKTRFPSVLRRKKEIVEATSLSPTRDFSMSGGRLSPSPGARYSSAVHQRSILRSIYNNLDYWIVRYKEVI